jgi:hypothetical protein
VVVVISRTVHINSTIQSPLPPLLSINLEKQIGDRQQNNRNSTRSSQLQPAASGQRARSVGLVVDEALEEGEGVGRLRLRHHVAAKHQSTAKLRQSAY